MKYTTKKHIPAFAMVTLVVLVIYTISLSMPMIWGIYTSLKDIMSFIEDPVWPSLSFSFENYIQAFDQFKTDIDVMVDGTKTVQTVYYEHMMVNSLVYSVGSSFIQTAIICVTAYATSRFNFKFDKVIYTIVIVTMILPIIGSLPSELRMAKAFHLYDTIWGMFLMKANFLGMYYLVFHAMFRALPKDFDEAAYMDGAGNFTIFFRINLPLVVGTFVTVMLIKFIDFWNDYMTPMIYMPNYPTIAYGLYKFIQDTTNGKSGTQIKLSACMLVFIPNFLIFIIFRNKLIGNISMGGLKE